MATSLDFAGEILILTGTPGSGKTTTAAALAELPGSPKVHLHSDDFWGYIKHGKIPPYLPEAHAQNDVVMDVLLNVVGSYARGGYFVVLDGIIGPWFLPVFRALTIPMHYIVLRPPLEVAVQRCKARGGDTLAASGPIRDLHRQFSALGDLERHALPTDDRNRSELLQAVVDATASGAFRLA